ncbi:MAG: efflux RND transporter periplasmic adaptor subunit [Saprospiraceae bacterium]|nr:efflux RND transporter periplasmic adaptor subunit [Saprospiraceae bacterium]
MKKIIMLLLPLTFVYCKNESKKDFKAFGGPPKSSKADGYVVSSGTFSEQIQVPGTVLAYETTDIQSETSGKIVSLNIREGSFYPKGTLIAKINDDDLQAKLSKLKIQLQIAQAQVKRQAELLKINAIGQQEFDAVDLNFKSLQSDIEILKTEIRKTEIRTPYAGVLGFKMISPGAYISPQTKITTISQTDKLKLEFALPERYLPVIRNGMIVNLKLDSSRKVYKAKIYAIEPFISQDSRSLNVRAEIIQTDKFIQPGMFASVDVGLSDKNNVIKIPSQAIIAQARDKKVVVYKGGKAEFKTVVTGIRDASNVEIIEGLTVGDTILITGILTAKPDSKIELTSVKN